MVVRPMFTVLPDGSIFPTFAGHATLLSTVKNDRIGKPGIISTPAGGGDL